MKQYKPVEILSDFQNVKSTCANVNPLLQAFWLRFWFETLHPFAWRFRYVRFSGVWKSNKHANREPSSCNYLDRFSWRVLLVCARFLRPW